MNLEAHHQDPWWVQDKVGPHLAHRGSECYLGISLLWLSEVFES